MTHHSVGDGTGVLSSGAVDASGVDGRDLDVVAGSAETSTPEASTRFGQGRAAHSLVVQSCFAQLRDHRPNGPALCGRSVVLGTARTTTVGKAARRGLGDQ